jgi:hypothetical protein
MGKKDKCELKYCRVESDDCLFDSGWVTHEDHKLFVSRAVLGVCNAIQLRFPSLEWAILLKGEWTKFGFEIANSYAVPQQEVTSGNVFFDDKSKEEYIEKGYNVILHSHHNMGIGFSHSDHSTLTDSSFAASLLYSNGEIKQATCSITVKEGVRVAISPKVVVLDFQSELPEWIGDRIKKREFVSNNWKSDEFTRKVWDNLKYRMVTEDKVWNITKGAYEWVPREDKWLDEPEKKIYVRLSDGTLIDRNGKFVNEGDLKGTPHEILTEDEEIERQIPFNLYG